MTAGQVRRTASDWILTNGSEIPGFCGAFFAGSINWTDEDVEWPATSDVDVFVVVDSTETSELERGIRHYGLDDVLLEVSVFASERFQTAEEVLSDYPMACHFSVSSIITDPTGKLNELHNDVSEHYAERKWIRKRIQQLNESVLSEMEEGPFDLFFTVTRTAQVLLLANLLSPTWRKALMISREILASMNNLSLHEKMLEFFGCADLDPGEVESLFTQCATAFEYAKGIVCTPFVGDVNISDLARPKWIGGSREVIDMGYHREAVPWMLVIRSLCQTAINNDAPEDLKDRYDEEYKGILERLGLGSSPDYEQRAVLGREMLKETMHAAEVVMKRNPDVIDSDSKSNPSIQ